MRQTIFDIYMIGVYIIGIIRMMIMMMMMATTTKTIATTRDLESYEQVRGGPSLRVSKVFFVY